MQATTSGQQGRGTATKGRGEAPKAFPAKRFLSRTDPDAHDRADCAAEQRFVETCIATTGLSSRPSHEGETRSRRRMRQSAGVDSPRAMQHARPGGERGAGSHESITHSICMATSGRASPGGI